MNDKETLSYDAMVEIKNQIISIASEMATDFNNSKRLIEAIESEGVFVTDIGSKTLQEKYAEFVATFDPFLQKLNDYGNFLTAEVNTRAQATDAETGSIFKKATDSFYGVINQK